MKNKLKVIYKKDKYLALQIAKLLNYKIVSSNINTDIKNFINKYCKKMNVDPINIIFTSKSLGKGPAYYKTHRFKGTKTNIPDYIKIGEWNSLRPYPDEWIPIIAHELSHHINNMLKNSLQHNKDHSNLSNKIENDMNRIFNKDNKEIKRLKDKIKYWEDHKEELKEDYHKVNIKVDIEKEIEKMKNKLKNLIK